MASKRINQKATQVGSGKLNTSLNDINYDERKGKLAFSSACNRRCLISDWQKSELENLIETFKKFESIEWKKIYDDSGLNWERNSHIAIKLPKSFPKDAKLHSIRVNGKMRLYGYRVQEFFYIVWFDKNHEVCPMNKNKKHSA